VRTATSLERAAAALASFAPTDVEEANLLTVSAALVRAAAARGESRGTHTRGDHPETSADYLGRFVFAGDADPSFVPLFAAAGTGR
jgi:L-aspartate oxidase